MDKRTKKPQPAIKKKTLPSNGNDKSYPTWWLALIFLSAFFVYSNTLKHQYALDDDIYCKQNKFVQQGFSAIPQVFSKGSLVGFNGANDSNYRPLVVFNFMLEVQSFGNKPAVHHFFNIVFYGLLCIVLFKFLAALTNNYKLALVAAMLFALHPVHTEVVANIKSRDEILAGLFGLSSLLFFLKWIDNKKSTQLIITIVLFFLACLCKENSLSLIIIYPLLIWFKQSVSVKEIILKSLPLFVIVIIYMVIRASVLDSVTFNEKMAVINNSLMAATSTAEMYATNFVILGKYLELLFFPVNLSWDYTFNQIPVVGWSNIKVILSLLAYVGLGIYAIYGLLKKDLKAFGIIFYLSTLFLSSNLVVKIGATMGERFLFLPSVGFCLVISMLLFRLFQKNQTALYAVVTVVCILYAGKTYSRNKVWKNNFTLFSSGVITSPQSARTHYSLAGSCRVLGESEPNPLKRKEYFETAEKEYLSGLAIYKDPEALYNLGVTYYNMQQNEKAYRAYLETVKLNPEYTAAWNNLGVIYFNKPDYDSAAICFTKVIEIDSTYADALGNLGAIKHNRGNYKEAINYYERSLRHNPDNANSYNNLIKAYYQLGDTAKAEAYKKRIQSPVR